MAPRSDPDRLVNALLEEYRALYGLVEFRMQALDLRVPVTAAAFATLVGSLSAIPPDLEMTILVGLPVALVWFARATVNHARSFEDVLRQIEAIEHRVNTLLGEDVLSFQSRHPSRHRYVGGRTGRESVFAVMVTVELLLGALGYRVVWTGILGSLWQWAYLGYVVAIGSVVAQHVYRLSRYRYRPHG